MKNILSQYSIRRDILTKEKYIVDGELTTKAHLIKNLNGYEQIPIINVIDNKTLAELNPIQIAGVISGLANIEYNTKGDIPLKPFKLTNTDDTEFVAAAQAAFFEVKNYERKISRLTPDKELSVNSKAMEHVYKWAESNCKSEKSRRNWQKLYHGDLRFSIRDEGTLFKEINMTIDLLKQLIVVCEDGELYSDMEADKAYYRKMSNKFKEAIYLIQQSPVTADSI